MQRGNQVRKARNINFKSLRVAKGFTQGIVARELNVHTQFISNIERRICMFPPEYFTKISKLYDVSVEDLIEFSVERFRKSLVERI